jgi:hypothetical protein
MLCARRVLGITFIRYDENGNIGMQIMSNNVREHQYRRSNNVGEHQYRK